ncbi:MAG TPA: acetate/propionate family kinase [Acidimicrobiales bacterium]|nr:acetate/propionate family kinase [Acidimicrobiales bacterium]
MRVLVVNAGSSSLKLSILDGDDSSLVDVELVLPAPGAINEVLARALRDAPAVDAVGHRVVHGGRDFTAPLLLEAASEQRLEQIAELAPLHNPPAIAAILSLQSLWPDLPQVACFDTAFHVTMPPEASTYALPDAWRDWGLRRFGFHGLSHAWASRRAAALLGAPIEQLRLVTAHLGAGASLAAVSGGRSVDTTMGFTPLEGLVMATRSGSVDPGVLLWVLRHEQLTVDELEDALDRRAGLLGLSGVSGDLREVLRAADGGDARSRLAFGVYIHRLRAEVGAMVAAMDGIDGLVFTGGAGEGSARLRHDACVDLGFLGIELDEQRNSADPGLEIDRVVSRHGIAPAVVVVRAREDLEIARQVRVLLVRPG